VVIVNYPSNGYDSFSTEEILACFETIKSAANAAGALCYIASTQPREDYNHFWTIEKRQILKNLHETIMNHFGPFAIDFWTDLADPVTLKRKPQYALANDLIHINSAGHKVLFENVVEKNIFAPIAVVPLHIGELEASWNKAADEVTVSFRVFESEGIREFYIKIRKPGGTTMRAGPFALDMINPNRKYTWTIKLH
jgi:hypothetical protein